MSDNGIVGSVMGSKGFVVGSFEFTGAASRWVQVLAYLKG